MRLRAKIDANQRAIVKALRQCGVSVLSLAALGRGVPDLLVYAPQLGYLLVEVKDGKKPPSARRLTDDQQAWIDNWRGPVYKVESVAEALELIGWQREP